MGLPLFLAAASTLLGISASSKSARAQQLQSERQARQMEIDRKIAEAQAIEVQNQRIYDYNYARSTNNAQFSFQLGGGESSSLAAFEKYQESTMSSDIASGQRQSDLEGRSRNVAAMIQRQRGASARSVSVINNLSSLFTLGSQIAKTYTPNVQTVYDSSATSIRPVSRSS